MLMKLIWSEIFKFPIGKRDPLTIRQTVPEGTGSYRIRNTFKLNDSTQTGLPTSPPASQTPSQSLFLHLAAFENLFKNYA